jgi:hypothetical protein
MVKSFVKDWIASHNGWFGVTICSPHAYASGTSGRIARERAI